MIYALLLIIALVIGAIINYFSDVLPVTRRLSCPLCWSCHFKMSLAQFLSPLHKCVNCRKKKKGRTWVVYVLSIGTTFWIWSSPPEFGIAVSLLILAYFGVVTVIDIEHLSIVYPVTMAGIIIGAIFGSYRSGISSTLLGGLGGFGVGLAYYFASIAMNRISAKIAKRDPADVVVGFADVLLAGIVGLIVGWPGILTALTLTLFASGIYGFLFIVVMKASRSYKPNTPFPFAPFILFGAFVLLFIKTW